MNQPLGTVDRLLVDESGRRPRADARRNVARLVEAARIAVAETGVGVSAHEIARRAGVGVGTFYRRIPSLEALLAAVLDEILDEIANLADQALEDPDPWHGFCVFAAGYVRLRTESCGVNEVLGGACGDALTQRLGDLRARIRRLVEGAQAAGAMRTDIAWQDVPFLLAAAATGERTLGIQAGSRQWERNLHIVLDGLRPSQTSMLPGSPPIWNDPEPEFRTSPGDAGAKGSRSA
ncbi:TetR/AcrR family transcriptional regulator [Streptomyces sp. SID3343]|uniref:TetR/AcrR family transcriptional regulator n=1 Tax=Streptomyces sp. SID3343 TaxID=2690260 RepID=UPI00136AAEC0|nr:TetR/AcrR family transcriptional regulator [Streptomyces sp. SID3343]MYW01854.1 TetR family transcriptional regulator [Streptomyces sp. SID3343]